MSINRLHTLRVLTGSLKDVLWSDGEDDNLEIYVEILLGETSIRSTVGYNTIEPVWNENIYLQLPAADVSSKPLVFVVKNLSPQSNIPRVLGSCEISVSRLLDRCKDGQEATLDLDGRSAVPESRTVGTIQLTFNERSEDDDDEATFLGYFQAGTAEWIDAQFGEGGTSKPPQAPSPIQLDVDDPLLTFPLNEIDGCQNSKRVGGWTRDDSRARNTLVNRRATFLNRIGQLCIQAKIYICKNEACQRNQESMARVIPYCEWPSFREWALAAMSCQAFLSQKVTRSHTHIVTAVSLCHSILEHAIKSENFLEDSNDAVSVNSVLVGKNGTVSLDLMGICEVIYWMLVIQGNSGYSIVDNGKWGVHFLPRTIFQRAVETSMIQAEQLGICQNRLRNLSLYSERGEIDLYAFIEGAQTHTALKHREHECCTSEVCVFSKLDTTLVKQAHKCSTLNCNKAVFPIPILEASLRSGGESVWSLSGNTILTVGQPFIAISHVWLDGTGVGVEKLGAGVVNECLWGYFASIARELGAQGLWWDTISIPSEPLARRKAVNSMHHNYADAQCTVIHDAYLLQFEWADDGSPCLALVLSPWFTRGWTALELSISRNVKVLYKGETPDKPLIKDLDKDILAHDPRRATRAHWIASSMIRRLRKPIETVSDLLTTLRPRSTSRESDKSIIAGLLVRLAEGYDYYNNSKQLGKVTRDILKRLGEISHISLLHEQETMTECCGFSWSPVEIYVMPTNAVGDLGKANFLDIDEEGVVSGWWSNRLVKRGDVKAFKKGKFVPLGPPTVVAKIEAALNKRKNCLILTENREKQSRGLLVVTVGKDLDDPNSKDLYDDFTINCRYVGCVEVKGGSIMTDHHRIRECIVRMGVAGRRDDMRARDIRKALESDDEVSSVAISDEIKSEDIDDEGDDMESDMDNTGGDESWSDAPISDDDEFITIDDLTESEESDEAEDNWDTTSDEEWYGKDT